MLKFRNIDGQPGRCGGHVPQASAGDPGPPPNVGSGGKAPPNKESAFPHTFGDRPGMTLWQWYAGMAMQGLMTNFSLSGSPMEKYQLLEIATESFKVADAMIAAEAA